MTHEERNRQIYHIIRTFEWQRLWDMLSTLDSMWFGNAKATHTPSIGEMVVEASKLLKEAATMDFMPPVAAIVRVQNGWNCDFLSVRQAP